MKEYETLKPLDKVVPVNTDGRTVWRKAKDGEDSIYFVTAVHYELGAVDVGVEVSCIHDR